MTFTPANWDVVQTVLFKVPALDIPNYPGPLPDLFPQADIPKTFDSVRKFTIYAPGYATKQLNVIKQNITPYIDPVTAGSAAGGNMPDVVPDLIISSMKVVVPQAERNYIRSDV